MTDLLSVRNRLIVLLTTERDAARRVIAALERRGVITTDPAQAQECCGLGRDEDGFCNYKPRHPIYGGVLPPTG